MEWGAMVGARETQWCTQFLFILEKGGHQLKQQHLHDGGEDALGATAHFSDGCPNRK